MYGDSTSCLRVLLPDSWASGTLAGVTFRLLLLFLLLLSDFYKYGLFVPVLFYATAGLTNLFSSSPPGGLLGGAFLYAMSQWSSVGDLHVR